MTLLFSEQHQQHKQAVSAEGVWATAFDDTPPTNQMVFHPASVSPASAHLPGIGLMSGVSRKNGWQIAEEVGEPTRLSHPAPVRPGEMGL